MKTNMTAGITRGDQNPYHTIEYWTIQNPVLLSGQIGIVSDIPGNPFKFGDGVTPWNELPFHNEYPNSLYLGPGTHDDFDVGTIITVPEYIVYDNTDWKIYGHLKMWVDRVFCRPRTKGSNVAMCYRGFGGALYDNAYDLIGILGEKSTQIKLNMRISKRTAIEIRYYSPDECADTDAIQRNPPTIASYLSPPQVNTVIAYSDDYPEIPPGGTRVIMPK